MTEYHQKWEGSNGEIDPFFCNHTFVIFSKKECVIRAFFFYQVCFLCYTLTSFFFPFNKQPFRRQNWLYMRQFWCRCKIFYFSKNQSVFALAHKCSHCAIHFSMKRCKYCRNKNAVHQTFSNFDVIAYFFISRNQSVFALAHKCSHCAIHFSMKRF